jgi:hypothetical protein
MKQRAWKWVALALILILILGGTIPRGEQDKANDKAPEELEQFWGKVRASKDRLEAESQAKGIPTRETERDFAGRFPELPAGEGPAEMEFTLEDSGIIGSVRLITLPKNLERGPEHPYAIVGILAQPQPQEEKSPTPWIMVDPDSPESRRILSLAADWGEAAKALGAPEIQEPPQGSLE